MFQLFVRVSLCEVTSVALVNCSLFVSKFSLWETFSQLSYERERCNFTRLFLYLSSGLIKLILKPI